MTDHVVDSDGAVSQVDGSLTLTEAARKTGISRSTVRRALDNGKFPNAWREPDGDVWRVPVADLLAAGYTVELDGEPPTNVIDLRDDEDPSPAWADRTALVLEQHQRIMADAHRRTGELALRLDQRGVELATEAARRARAETALAIRTEQFRSLVAERDRLRAEVAEARATARRRWWRRSRPPPKQSTKHRPDHPTPASPTAGS